MALDDVWLVVPTAGRATLVPAIDSTGIPRERVVVVCTTTTTAIPEGCLWSIDVGSINIQRWWNTGLDTVAARGGRFACVINDDVRLNKRTIPELLKRMDGATIASPGMRGLVTDPHGPRVMDGSCWLIDLSHGIRLDEGFRWWFGDDDLDYRARRDGKGVASVPCYFQHLHPNHLTSTTPALQALIPDDQARWLSRR